MFGHLQSQYRKLDSSSVYLCIYVYVLDKLDCLTTITYELLAYVMVVRRKRFNVWWVVFYPRNGTTEEYSVNVFLAEQPH